MLLYYSLAAFLPLIDLSYADPASAAASAQASSPPTGTWPTDIVGTWSTKSRSVLTGPGFYDPLSDDLIEPDHTGISYSFTSDGHYEEAYYRAIANPGVPDCPGGIMQWQHGSWTYNADGSLTLTPIAIDGRQLTSEPCTSSDQSMYVRYNQTEHFERYSQYVDPYHNVQRLDLYQFNGAPMQPMYLMYQPPQMLPTTTLNPVASTTAASSKMKRGEGSIGLGAAPLGAEVPLNWKAKLETDGNNMVQHINADKLWWLGLGMTGLGGLLYLGPRRMGIQI